MGQGADQQEGLASVRTRSLTVQQWIQEGSEGVHRRPPRDPEPGGSRHMDAPGSDRREPL